MIPVNPTTPPFHLPPTDHSSVGPRGGEHATGCADTAVYVCTQNSRFVSS